MTVRANRAYLMLAALFHYTLAVALMLAGILCWPLIVPALICAALSAVGGALYTRALGIRAPALQIDSDGIVDHTDCLPCGRIRWDEIRGVRTGTFLGIPALYLDLHDPDAFIGRYRPLMRRVLASNVATSGTPIGFHQWSVRTPLETIQQQIETELRLRRQTGSPAEKVAADRRHWWTSIAPEERGVQTLRISSR